MRQDDEAYDQDDAKHADRHDVDVDAYGKALMPSSAALRRARWNVRPVDGLRQAASILGRDDFDQFALGCVDFRMLEIPLGRDFLEFDVLLG